jgi:hypothetical protein
VLVDGAQRSPLNSKRLLGEGADELLTLRGITEIHEHDHGPVVFALHHLASVPYDPG